MSTISQELAISVKKEEVSLGTHVEVEKDEVVLIEKEAEIEDVAVDKAQVSVPTSVIQANNLTENYNTVYEDIKIKNETNFSLPQEILNPNIDFSNKTNIIIFHTHTCESYTQTKENSYIASRKL